MFQANERCTLPATQTVIKKIQDFTGRPLICYVSGIRSGIDLDDTMPFVDLLHNVPPGESAELLLHTPGDSVDAAEKLIRMVRSKVDEGEIHIIVPDFAKKRWHAHGSRC